MYRRLYNFVSLSVVCLVLAGCNSLKLDNVVKTSATTAVSYAVAGPVPAIANVATSVVVDEVMPQEAQIEDIKTTQQTVAYLGGKSIEAILYGVIAFFAFTTIIGPWLASRRANRKGYEKAKEKYKTQVRISEDVINQIKGKINE